MKSGKIIFSKYSPLMLVDTDLEGGDGKKIETPRVCSVCRCGKTNSSPLCDGSHSSTGFSGEREIKEKKKPEYYRGKEITIVFDRYLCMGAGYCGELEAVFGTHISPKYKPDAAPVEDIIEIIKKCPSGALSYIINDKHFSTYYSGTKAVAVKDGPLNCQGDVTIIDDQDSDALLPEGDHFTLCRCGKSRRKPFCDGSHAG